MDFSLRAGSFEDDNVTHVEGEVNPIRDLDIINEELRLKDEEYLSTHLEKLERTVLRGGDKKLKPEYVSLQSHMGLQYVVYLMLPRVEILKILSGN
jgi:obg-like ATPase 1